MSSLPDNDTTNTTHLLWNSTLSMTPQQNLNMLVFHSVMMCLGVIGNSLVLYCAVTSARINCPVHLSRRNDNGGSRNNEETSITFILETSMRVSAARGRNVNNLNNRIIKQNCIAFQENLAINSLVICMVVLLPIVCNHVFGRYVLGESSCNLMAQGMEILYITRVSVYLTLSVYSFCTVVWPLKTIVTKVPQVKKWGDCIFNWYFCIGYNQKPQ